MKLEDIKDLADKQYDEADWSTTFSDWVKEIPEYISIDYSYFKEAYTTAYKLGFEEGYQAAKGIPTDEFGNFILEFTPESHDDEIKTLRAENARYIERIEELTAELEFYKNRVNKAWGE